MKRAFIQCLSAMTAAFLLLTYSPPAECCTHFMLKGDNDEYIRARTMEFAPVCDSSFVTFPPKRRFHSTAPNQQPGKHWNGQYGFVVAKMSNCVAPPPSPLDPDEEYMFDGVNTRGLTVATLLFQGTEYPPDVEDPEKALNINDFVIWALSTKETVFQVLKDIESREVDLWGKTTDMPGHLSITDAYGDYAVIEFIEGEINQHHGYSTQRIRVTTNAPDYMRHLDYLGKYEDPYVSNLDSIQWEDWDIFDPPYDNPEWVHGSGMLNLPGDSTPVSRFVRIAKLKQYTLPNFHYNPEAPKSTTKDWVLLAQHLMNTIDIPVGTVEENTYLFDPPYGQTTWNTIYEIVPDPESDPQVRVYFYSYENTLLRSFNLNELLENHDLWVHKEIDIEWPDDDTHCFEGDKIKYHNWYLDVTLCHRITLLDPNGPNVLFVSNDDFPYQESAFSKYLETKKDAILDIKPDYDIHDDTDLSMYDFVVITGFAPNISNAGIQNIIDSDIPVLIIEYWDFWYSYKLGLVESDWAIFGGNTMTAVDSHDISIQSDVFESYDPPYYSLGCNYWDVENHVDILYEDEDWGVATVLVDVDEGESPIVSTGLYKARRYTEDSWDLFSNIVDYLMAN